MTRRGARGGRGAALVLLALALGGWARCGAPVEVRLGDWQLVWSDEFEGPAGTLPDLSRWAFDVGGGGWGNGQLEYDTDRPENASLDGEGNLAITARRESFGGRAYTSARIKTQGKFSQARGRFEARIKLPVGQGIWPAFWLLGAGYPLVAWPECGEIDVMEYRGQEPRVVLGSAHGPGYSGGGSITGRFELPAGQGFDAGFHVFAVEWDPGRLAFFVDDALYHVVTPSTLPPGSTWVFEQPFYVILNVAVGGTFVGPPGPTTVFPQTMLVDWVRVHERGP